MPQVFRQSILSQKSFAGQDLTAANFSGADIRGKDFTGACLINADFSNAIAGLSPHRLVTLRGFAVFLAVLSGLITGYAGATLGYLFTNPDPTCLSLGLFVAIILILFGIFTLRSGLGFALGLISLIAACTIVALVAITTSEMQAGRAAISSLALGGAIAGVVGLAEAISLCGSIKLSLIVNLLGIILGSLLGVSDKYVFHQFVGVVLVSSCIVVLATYMAKKALRGDVRYRLIRELTIRLSTAGGTRFCNANLTDANLTGASLPSTDFRGACLTRVRWLQAQLERANLERTPLENPRIRQLLTDPIRSGVGQKLDHLDLQGANLQDANLTDASLINTDLSNANLQGADLSRAKLVQTQLYGANLSGAKLTGAYIQNWGIAPDTKIAGVHCDYIYMRLPTTQDPDPCRKPDNRQEMFKEGDFTDFIAPIIRTLDSYQQQNVDPRSLSITPKTLDLFHHEGIDPSAAAIALRQLIEQHPEANIDLVSIEGRGQEKVRLQAQVSEDADPSQLNSDYFDNYNKLKKLAIPDLQKLIASIEEKDIRIRSLEKLVMTAIGSSKFYIETASEQSSSPKTVLILAVTPKGTPPLRLDEEVRAIQEDRERAKKRDQFHIEPKGAVQSKDLRRALLDFRPQIVHFSGHGMGTEDQLTTSAQTRDLSAFPEDATAPEGLLFEDETGHPKLVSVEALSDLFQELSDSIECVVLNACYSKEQAKAIVQHIPYVIGMKRAIGDRAAIEFAIGFYDGIFAGESIERAFKLGRNAIHMAGINEHLTPELLKRDELKTS